MRSSTGPRTPPPSPRASDELPKAPAVLLLIDVINDLGFDGGKKLLRQALPMAQRLAALVRRARAEHVPVIYANDNFGRWRSDFRAQVTHCLEDGVCGRPIADLLRPTESDYFVLKPKHSAFFSTALESLLQGMGARSLVLTGLAGDNCVLFTAHDAYMRDYRLTVPSDCIASERADSNRWALDHMKRFLKADVRTGARVDFADLAHRKHRKSRAPT
jgi:nicotinamidase-related amidase